MLSVFKRVAALAVLVFVVACSPTRSLGDFGHERQVTDDRIRICVSNQTIDAMNVRITGIGGNTSIFSRTARWVYIRPENVEGGARITAHPVGGGEEHYAPLYSLNSAPQWIWEITTFPSNSLVSLRPIRGDVPCD